ncbi:MAG: methyltransferase domain-containing protein [Bacteroidota bacterium]
MKFDDVTLEYLRGKKFTNSLVIPYDYYGPIPNRVAFLRDLVKGKYVIHLGCLDHLPLIDDKIKRGQWLHKEITESAKKCIGIDIDKEANDHVQSKYKFDNILIGDFTTTRFPQVVNEQWDYAVLGELLEHIDNPVAFLEAIRKNYSGCLRSLVITVPNAWTRHTMKMAKRSAEIINSDHRYWFTPYTLAKVIIQAGMQPSEIYFANRVPLSKPELVKQKLSKMIGVEPRYNFTYASSIVAVANL